MCTLLGATLLPSPKTASSLKLMFLSHTCFETTIYRVVLHMLRRYECYPVSLVLSFAFLYNIFDLHSSYLLILISPLESIVRIHCLTDGHLGFLFVVAMVIANMLSSCTNAPPCAHMQAFHLEVWGGGFWVSNFIFDKTVHSFIQC